MKSTPGSKPPQSALRIVGIDSARKHSNKVGFPPEPSGNTKKMAPVFVLDCVREAMAYRWLQGAKMDTIRRDLGVPPSIAEEIVRAGVQARKVAA